ncbi:NAD(P)/FAD-dependent oxidoreductase [Amnibacterium kyonggiense]|uniref:Glycine/D-amino acid oxidase-like deaminating enzyme n=1 Tax=Amnibacterium kyonggiense TaxID=595671 RepID=A0A4R7FGK2_9MICO|nr:FAD-binding oxidoreductase [Amnibacterium kyonggiense]TDS75757.1 glycine/D-amino acid oxidase-like deaminating enzyme [Amnibacterium kyonggiense]
MTDPRSVSFWLDDLAATGFDDLAPRATLPGDVAADVCIVGAGFTGLWTAVSVLEREPDARVVVVEREFAGFGASGRNGGWVSALFPVGPAELARRHGDAAARAMSAAMLDTVAEVGRAAGALGIDCDYDRQGTFALVRSGLADRAAAAEQREAEEAGQPVPERRSDPALGETLWTEACASVHPGKLVRGLARAAEERGTRVFERTHVTGLEPGRVTTTEGTVVADRVVVATEAWGSELPGVGRRILPLYSLVLATEPLPGSVWAAIGLPRGATVTDFRHNLVYGQRTADDRLVFGGRGARYHLGSAIRPAYDRSAVVHRHLERELAALFPAAAGARVTHRWGGPLGVPRDWHAFVSPLAGGRVVVAGGYVGDGVATANLAGRTVADLVTDRRTPLTALPWVGKRPPRWEPEPLRMAGVNAVIGSLSVADAEERLLGRPSRIAAIAGRLGRE